MHVSGNLPFIDYFACLMIIILGLMFSGCSRDIGTGPQDPGQSEKTGYAGREISIRDMNPCGFAIRARYNYIRSYPTGGGIFVIRLRPDTHFSGDVSLSFSANVQLNARLDRNFLSRNNDIAEITIRPGSSVAIKTHIIEVKATQGNTSEIINLEVEIINWPGCFSEEAVQKRDKFIDWLHKRHPEFGDFSERDWFVYATYPSIWVVEHWTFLDSDWEIRICWHVMIPPYDWSKIMLRRRGEWAPIFAAHRDTEGNIYEIPVSEYPLFEY
jgi:hypothetical protein